VSTTSAQFLRNCAASLLLAIGILSPADALRAAPPVQAWVQRYLGAEGTKIAVGPDGNVVVVGSIRSYRGGLVIKYSSSGVSLWTNLWGCPGSSIVQDMAVGTNGTIAVTGYGPLGKTPSDYITTAYSAAGIPLWTNLYHGVTDSYDHAKAVAVDGNGNVYVTGYSLSTNYHSSDCYDFITIAYAGTGAPLWTNRYLAGWYGYRDYPLGIAVDAFSHVYVAGTAPFGEGWSTYCTIAYSSTGTQLWAKSFPQSVPFPTARAVAVDGTGNVFVSGETMTTVGFSSGGTTLWLTEYDSHWDPAAANAVAVGTNGNVYIAGYGSGASTGCDYLSIAYSSLGAPLWTNRYNGPGDTNDYAQALAVGNDGTVYVTGYSWGAGSFYDYLTIAYSSDGVPLWTNRYNGPANGYDQAFAMAVDGSGNIYVTGYSQGDCTTIKYVPAPAIRFSAIDLISGPACRLTITGTSNLVFRLEASTNLADWQTLTNYSTLPLNSIQYTDALAPDFPRRYYRTAWAP
jgi:hypothetical protein